MGIFASIKNKILRRREGGEFDYQDMRSTVINEPPRPEGQEPYEPPTEMPMTAEPPEPRFLRSQQAQQEPPVDERFRTPEQRRYEELTVDQPSMQQMASQPAGERYDVMDKLNVIEAQLSAIRSQTETINERLKNLELRLPRRGY